jgi:RimJ/RimL family protein N-acetyltransferase
MLFPPETRDDVFWIETRRLWLRWPRPADVATLAPWIGKPEVASMTATWPVGIAREAIAERIAKGRARNTAGEGLVLVMTLRGASAIAIGQSGVSFNPDGTATLGYHLDPGHWGRGLMSEAVEALTHWTFLLTRTPRILANVRPDNPASRRVLEKCGFVPTGRITWQSPVRGIMELDSFALERSGRTGRCQTLGSDTLRRPIARQLESMQMNSHEMERALAVSDPRA